MLLTDRKTTWKAYKQNEAVLRKHRISQLSNNSNTVQWSPTNPNTSETGKFVLFNGVSTFQDLKCTLGACSVPALSVYYSVVSVFQRFDLAKPPAHVQWKL